MEDKEILEFSVTHNQEDENESDEDDENWEKEYQLLQCVKFKPKIKLICSPSFDANNFICFITEIGEVYFKGELEKYNYKEFTKIENISNIIFAGCGEGYVMLIDNENNLFGCGVDYGQSGLNKYNTELFNDIKEFTRFKVQIKDRIKLLHCGPDTIIIVTMDNKILFVGNSEVLNGKKEHIYEFKYFENNLPEINDLQCGFYHSIILDYNGNIYGSGSNKKGQLGFEDLEIELNTFQKLNVDFKVKKIKTKPNETVLLNYFNEIYICGNNNYRNAKPTIGFIKINLNLPFNIHSIKFLHSNEDLLFLLVNKNKFYYYLNHNKTIKEINAKFNRNWKYKHLGIIGEGDIPSFFAIGCDYKINKRIYNDTNSEEFKQKLFLQTLMNAENNFIDIEIVNEEIKRRNTIVDCNLDKIKKRKM
ncbi:hypothetical protein ABK040_003273 [Willaertia magna]